MKEFWNDRYGEEAYAYGTAPNAFFKQQLDKLKPGKLLLPAEGEGRNAVYAARKGWQVEACDLSEEGKKKAERLAREHNVTFSYVVGDFGALSMQDGSFDAVALIFAHFPAQKKPSYHQLVQRYLKPGGVVIVEAFNKQQLDYQKLNANAGGPKDKNMLISLDELRSNFDGFHILLEENVVSELSEGAFHQGKGSVVRFIAKKP